MSDDTRPDALTEALAHGLHALDRHDEPEGDCPSCAACAACDGSCGTCPYAAHPARTSPTSDTRPDALTEALAHGLHALDRHVWESAVPEADEWESLAPHFRRDAERFLLPLVLAARTPTATGDAAVTRPLGVRVIGSGQPTATGDDLRERVTALAEASDREGRGGTWVHDAWFASALAASPAPVVSRPEAADRLRAALHLPPNPEAGDMVQVVARLWLVKSLIQHTNLELFPIPITGDDLPTYGVRAVFAEGDKPPLATDPKEDR